MNTKSRLGRKKKIYEKKKNLSAQPQTSVGSRGKQLWGQRWPSYPKLVKRGNQVPGDPPILLRREGWGSTQQASASLPPPPPGAAPLASGQLSVELTRWGPGKS